jgi:hypothetical protein
METATTFRALKLAIYHGFLVPIRNPYLPPEYRNTFRPDTRIGKVVATLLDPCLKVRDRNQFLRRLRETDVFIVGHPKSGNTWLAYMIAIILRAAEAPPITMANIKEHIPHIHGSDGSIRKYELLRNPRFFRNEYPIHPECYLKTIYLIRDPRAVLVSYYHMYCVVRPREPLTLTAFLDQYLREGCLKNLEPLQRWDRQVAAWLKKASDNKRVLIVKYEDMLKDRKSIIERVIRFTDLKVEDNRIREAVDRGSFEQMQQDEEAHGAEAYLKIQDKREKFIRRGEQDGWKDELEPGMVARIEQELGPTMRAAGYL